MGRPILIGDTGEEFIYAEWHPDPEILSQEIIQIANNFEDWSVPMQDAKQLMIENTKILFEEQRDPNWIPWEPLNSDYADRKSKLGFPDEILVRSSAMKDYATSESAWFVSEDAIFFKAEGLPKDKDGYPYGAAHQDGTIGGIKGQRFKKAYEKPLAQLTAQDAEILAAARGLNLPQRQFIGATEGTIADIQQVFIDFIEKTIEVPWRGRGGIINDLGYGSNIEGTFPIIGFLPTGQPRLSTGRFGRK